MATLLITLGEGSGPTSQIPITVDDDTALRQAHQIRKLLRAWRYPVYTVRDAGGGEICRFDVRKLRSVDVVASISPLPTPACGKSAAANDESIR